METIYTIIQNFQLDLSQVLISSIILFILGFWAGRIKSRKLERKMAKMEKEILDLNAELLYNDQPAGVLKMHH
ncbi:MAG TPA: hypothetical protein VGM30_21530 [Puia sp.]|jgi:hypothetical protein